MEPNIDTRDLPTSIQRELPDPGPEPDAPREFVSAISHEILPPIDVPADLVLPEECEHQRDGAGVTLPARVEIDATIKSRSAVCGDGNCPIHLDGCPPREDSEAHELDAVITGTRDDSFTSGLLRAAAQDPALAFEYASNAAFANAIDARTLICEAGDSGEKWGRAFAMALRDLDPDVSGLADLTNPDANLANLADFSRAWFANAIETAAAHRLAEHRRMYADLLALNHELAGDLGLAVTLVKATGMCKHTHTRDERRGAPDAAYLVTLRLCRTCGAQLPMGKAADKYQGHKIEVRAAELAQDVNGGTYGSAIGSMTYYERNGFQHGPNGKAGPIGAETDAGAIAREITHTLDDLWEGY